MLHRTNEGTPTSLRKECEKELEKNGDILLSVTQVISVMYFFSMDVENFKKQMKYINLQLKKNQFLQDRLFELVRQSSCRSWCCCGCPCVSTTCCWYSCCGRCSCCEVASQTCARLLKEQQQVEFFKLVLTYHMSRGLFLEKQQRNHEAFTEFDTICLLWNQCFTKQPGKFKHKFEGRDVDDYMPSIALVYQKDFAMEWFVRQVFVNAFYHCGLSKRHQILLKLKARSKNGLRQIAFQEMLTCLKYTFFALWIDYWQKDAQKNCSYCKCRTKNNRHL